ncbi:MAG: Fic family protein [Verrucomicrobia bacterium]|nr:Fic family protein [Verrucomicrobiota bacterium]
MIPLITTPSLALNSSQKGETFPAKPSKEEAHKIFWKLGDDFWKQIIDGKCHSFGHLVFDQGLHGSTKEPGFFDSLKIGCHFASEHLSEPLTISFYKDLHKKLCSHFKGRENGTEMHAEESGHFRTCGTYASFSIINDISDFAKERYQIVKTIEDYTNFRELAFSSLQAAKEASNTEDIEFWENCIKNTDAGIESWGKRDEYPAAKEWVTHWERQWKQNGQKLVEYIEKRCQNSSIPQICSFSYEGIPTLKLDYKTFENENEVEKIVEILFDYYNRSIEEINSRFKDCNSKPDSEMLLDEKLSVIADLYQMLEWLHPFPDGQGRTDLVLLCKLLCEQGLNPAILHQPYMSSYSTLQEWKEYLINGINLWKK